MGLGLPPWEGLENLSLVKAGVTKFPAADRAAGLAGLKRSYNGNSLSIYHLPSVTGEGEETPKEEDPIGIIMVPSKLAIGHFGSVARKLIYGVGRLQEKKFVDYVRAVHALTEAATQRVLSVKAGDKPLLYSEFKKHVVGPLLKGEPPSTHQLPKAIEDFLTTKGIRKACDLIAKAIRDNPAPRWCQWLRSPATLGQLLHDLGGEPLELPLDDPRVIALLAPVNTTSTRGNEPRKRG
jgi:hypothetical protein